MKTLETFDPCKDFADHNLRVDRFRNGDLIPEAKTEYEWVEYGEQEIPAFMRNGDDFHYNHYAVADSRGLAPEGYRIPKAKELEKCIKSYKLLECLNWPKAGRRDYDDGSVFDAGSHGDYWSSTVGGSNARSLNFNSFHTSMVNSYRAFGYSVRCLKDEPLDPCKDFADHNLRVDRFRNGDLIPEAKTENEWVEFSEQKTPAFMRNGDDFHYNHYAVADSRGLAPKGYRIPREEELEKCIQNRKLLKCLNWPSAGTRRSDVGSVIDAGSNGYYWSSAVDGSFARLLRFRSSSAYVDSLSRALGGSVRCLKDEPL